MFLRAQPDKAKSKSDREEIAKAYKPGDDVIPPVHVSVDSDDSENERMLAEARELSLQDQDPDRARIRRSEQVAQHTRHRRRQEPTSRTTYLNYRSEELGREEQTSQSGRTVRQIEHQSSLRSLLSASDIDSHSQEVQEDIIRQIADEGLLDGIDLNSLTPSQEEEITERIALAVTRRQRELSLTSGDHQRPDRSPHPAAAASATRHRHHARAESTSNQPHHDRPPASRPHLLEATQNNRRQRDRSSSRTSQRSNQSSHHVESRMNVPVSQSASRSVTDLSNRPRAEPGERPRRISHGDRSTTDPEGHTASARAYRDRIVSVGNSQTQRTVLPPSQRVTSGSRPSSQGHGAATTNPLDVLRSRDRPTNISSPALISTSNSAQGSSTTSSVADETRAFPEPSISCSRCKKPDIQYSLHYHCRVCASGNFDICVSCYRSGKGCLHWFGFGYAAKVRFDKSSSGSEPPHVLIARRYRQKSRDSIPHDPEQRLEQGLFCEGCFTFSDSCYWHCDICLEGAWGYCQQCVQTGKHCTHPLQSMGHRSSNNGTQTMYLLGQGGKELYPAPLQTINSATSGPAEALTQSLSTTTVLPNVTNPTSYIPLSLPSYCDICTRSIPPSHTRFHCYGCNAGDYDICTSCYHNVVATGKISSDNGHQGWRRCLRGHRMSVIGFEDREGGQRRVVVREMVGGWALKEEDDPIASSDDPKWRWREADGKNASVTSQLAQVLSPVQRTGVVTMLPPDGGVGLRVVALWSYFPGEDVADELAFPRNAEIREVEDINGDWFWGVYAGTKGLFPGNHGRVV